MVKLDVKDKKILHTLDINARQPVSSIARKIRLSRDIVNYRMKKFIEDNIVFKYHTIIDIARLGYTAHKVFIRFQNITQEKEKKFIEFIKKHPDIVYSANYDGRFDIVISIWAKNIIELSRILKDIEAKFGEFIAERQIATIIRGEYMVKDYLIGKKTQTRRKYFFGATPKPIKIDDINKKILVELGKDARISSVEIANKLGLSADAIYQRIKKLEKSGVIQSYNFIPNEKADPYTHYKLLISLHHMTEEKENKFLAYCRSQQNIWFFGTILGPWNFEIDLSVETKEDFRNLLRNLKLHFPEIIKDYTAMTVFRTNKYNFCPSTPK